MVFVGALRRIIMNIFGNAQKYTDAGFILVQLRIRVAEDVDGLEAAGPHKQILVLNITDSGCGMSNEFMERKLYTPFAQEDSFAPGVGLGLSIVYVGLKMLSTYANLVVAGVLSINLAV